MLQKFQNLTNSGTLLPKVHLSSMTSCCWQFLWKFMPMPSKLISKFTGGPPKRHPPSLSSRQSSSHAKQFWSGPWLAAKNCWGYYLVNGFLDNLMAFGMHQLASSWLLSCLVCNGSTYLALGWSTPPPLQRVAYREFHQLVHWHASQPLQVEGEPILILQRPPVCHQQPCHFYALPVLQVEVIGQDVKDFMPEYDTTKFEHV